MDKQTEVAITTWDSTHEKQGVNYDTCNELDEISRELFQVKSQS